MKWYVHCKLEIPPVLLLGKPLHWMTMNWKTNLIVQTMRTQLLFPFLKVEIVKRSAVKVKCHWGEQKLGFPGGCNGAGTVAHCWVAQVSGAKSGDSAQSTQAKLHRVTGWTNYCDSTNIVLHCNVSTNIWEGSKGSAGLVGFLIDQVPKIIWLFRLFKGWLYQVHFTQIQTMC